jgi:tRNA(Ile)-lysidine synthetase-like protein
MADLFHQVRRTIRRFDLLRDGMALVVGVSGGPDSLCLLHLLSRLAPEMGLRLHVAHLNHRLRGTDADADADFVAEFAAGLGAPCTVGRAEVAELAREAGLSLEEAARQARYRFLAEVAADAGADTIAVGHNADDQAETVLMHFLRGSGVAGLRGMQPKTQLGEFRLSGEAGERRSGGAGERGSGGADAPFISHSPLPPLSLSPFLIRPLLATPRAAIEAYCAEHGLQPRFDRSNEDTTIHRNRLRCELLPILESYNPRIREVLAHTAEVLGGDHEVLRTAVDEAWDRVRTREREIGGVGEWESRGRSPGLPLSHSPVGRGDLNDVRFDLAAWRALPLGLQRATIREAIHRLRASLRNINWEHVERAVWLAREGTTGQKATLAAGLELEISYRTLRIGSEATPVSLLQRASLFQPGDSPPGGVPQIGASLPLVAPGETALGGGWRVQVSAGHIDGHPKDRGAGADPWVAFLDADALGSGLLLRPRQPGDRFQPQGLDGHSTKLNEFMINARVPKDARAGWPLLCSAAGIAWVCGLRVAEWAIVRPETQAVWVVQFISPVESEWSRD